MEVPVLNDGADDIKSLMVGKKKVKKHYIDNKKFEKLIQQYILDKTDKEVEDELVKYLDLLISNILLTFRFSVDHEDAKQECFLLVFKILKNFNKEAGSAFNYFTTVIVNNCKLLYTKNKKYYIKMEEYKELITGNRKPSGNPPPIE